LSFIIAVVSWDCSAGAVVVVAVIVGEVVNADEVGGAGISIDETDVTI
jgi:hypothetical protein